MTFEMADDQSDDWFDPESTTFGDRVAGAREKTGMVQNELADRLGVKLKTLRDWENDLSEPRANKLSMMSGVLGVSLTWLMNGEGQGIDAPSDDADRARDLGEAAAELRALRKEAVRFVERMDRLEQRLRSLARDSAE